MANAIRVTLTKINVEKGGLSKLTYEEYYQQAENHYIKRNYQEALRLFLEALKLKESNDCLNYIGCCYLELKDFKTAGELFLKLSEDNLNWERPAFNLGRVFLKSGYIEEALTAFKEAERRNPNNEDVYYYLGVYYYQTKDYMTAKAYYDKSLSINDEQAETHLNLGRCYYHLGMNDKAIQEFNIAFEYDSNCSDAIYNKGITLISMNEYQQALDNLLIVNEMNPNDVEVMLDIAQVFYKTKDFESATIWINKVLAIEPQHDLGNKLLKDLHI